MTRDELVACPPGLPELAAEEWARVAPTLAEMGTLTPDTRDRLRRRCCAYAAALQLQRPTRRQIAAWRLFFMLSRGFGTTPADVVRLVTAGKVGPEWLPGRGCAP